MQKRAFELDFLRGLAIIMMILHHLIYDLRYIMGLDLFAWQESYFFEYWLRAPFVFIFLAVSGVCCTFSSSNIRRSGKMALVAAGFSAVFFAVSTFTDSEMYVIFNVIHILAVGTFLYAVLEVLASKGIIRDLRMPLLILVVVFLWLEYPLSAMDRGFVPVLIPLHDHFSIGLGMADYMPLVPWIGLFFAGALFGRLFYAQKQSLFPNPPPVVQGVTAPFAFVGRHSLLFYILHQPIVLAILFLLRWMEVL
jgi:uncharacterized membrane protein